jgi:hypothetical protein
MAIKDLMIGCERSKQSQSFRTPKRVNIRISLIIVKLTSSIEGPSVWLPIVAAGTTSPLLVFFLFGCALRLLSHGSKFVKSSSSWSGLSILDIDEVDGD